MLLTYTFDNKDMRVLLERGFDDIMRSACVRVNRYYGDGISREIGKMLCFVTLGVSLLCLNEFNHFSLLPRAVRICDMHQSSFGENLYSWS